MKTIIYYECEICGQRWLVEDHARSCERRGKPEVLPIGLIYGNVFHGKDLTFAVKENRPEGHRNWPTLWACRDNGCGDSLGDECCGSVDLTLTKYNHALTESAGFRRMVDYLKSVSITPRYWDGEKIVELNE